jgi:hypothetical protein
MPRNQEESLESDILFEAHIINTDNFDIKQYLISQNNQLRRLPGQCREYFKLSFKFRITINPTGRFLPSFLLARAC